MIYQLKVTLENVTPLIWRRIEISGDTKLSDLHKILQSTMGWMNGHLHQFIVGQEYYSPPSEWDDMGTNYKGMKINRFLSSIGDKIRYEYDFGDSWVHKLELEKITEKEKGATYPRCIKGKRACPPEDCGGVWGYMNLQEIMKNPDHSEYDDMLEWLGGELEPELFELEKINSKLKSKNHGVFSYDF